MIIVAKLKLDLKQLPYWSFMLVDDHTNNRIMHEVISQTFDVNDNYNKWKQYEMASNRMAKELMGEAKGNRGKAFTIAKMFLDESVFDKTENRN